MPDAILIPTNFKSQTSLGGLKGKFKGRGVELQAIDHALEEYNRVRAGGNRDAQCAALYGVAKACKQWQGSRRTRSVPLRRR